MIGTFAVIHVIHPHTKDRTAHRIVLKACGNQAQNVNLGLPMGAKSFTSLNAIELLLSFANASAVSKAFSVSRKARISPLLCAYRELLSVDDAGGFY